MTLSIPLLDSSAAGVPESSCTAELVARVRLGDADALATVYRAHAPALFRLAVRLLGDAAEAEDVVHDLFVGLPRSLGSYEERGAFAGWLRRLAARAALMRLRAGRRRREVALAPEHHDVAGPRAPAGLDWPRLARALDALPATTRAVVVLHVLERYPHAEIGTLLGISAGASRVRLTRGLAALRALLGEER